MFRIITPIHPPTFLSTINKRKSIAAAHSIQSGTFSPTQICSQNIKRRGFSFGFLVQYVKQSNFGTSKRRAKVGFIIQHSKSCKQQHEQHIKRPAGRETGWEIPARCFTTTQEKSLIFKSVSSSPTLIRHPRMRLALQSDDLTGLRRRSVCS